MERVKKIIPTKSRIYSYIKVLGGVTLTLGAVVGGSLVGYQSLMDEGTSVLDGQDISETLDPATDETSVQNEKELNGPNSASSGDEMVKVLENKSEQELYQRYGC